MSFFEFFFSFRGLALFSLSRALFFSLSEFSASPFFNKKKLKKTKQNREYVRAGTYLLLEKLRPAVARRLVRKVAALHAASAGGPGAPGAHQLPLSKIATALEWSGSPSDPDAVECLVARLIYRRLIKGYIAHKAGVLVLSKADPFPSLEAVSLADPL